MNKDKQFFQGLRRLFYPINERVNISLLTIAFSILENSEEINKMSEILWFYLSHEFNIIKNSSDRKDHKDLCFHGYFAGVFCVDLTINENNQIQLLESIFKFIRCNELQYEVQNDKLVIYF